MMTNHSLILAGITALVKVFGFPAKIENELYFHVGRVSINYIVKNVQIKVNDDVVPELSKFYLLSQ